MDGPDNGDRGLRRRNLVRDGVLVAFGAGVGAVGFAEAADVTDRRLPLRSGAAETVARDQPDEWRTGDLRVTWCARTRRKVVALTFDDGPGPRWTPMVLDILHQQGVPATFFMVGEQVRRHAALVRGRLAGHEVGSHTWAHRDLGRVNPDEAYDDLTRTHQEIAEVTGQEPRLLRPPYGHLGGSALTAAARMGYQVALWSRQMQPAALRKDPSGQVFVANIKPGTIVLAHDVGEKARLVALRSLPDIIDGLKARNYTFMTVSELLATGDQPSPPPHSR
jgi:peptidoglycan/xylan/chitin deacetylase (PgdA/CDA1 family)